METLEGRQLLAGVTIITHGYDGNITGWVKSAADDIAARIGSSDVARYVMTVGKNSKGNLAVTAYSHDGGPLVENTMNAEAIVRLDWSSVSDGDYSTIQVGNAVSDFLMHTHSSARLLAMLPIHLIGHSRGASLMTVVAQHLGECGIWVDQLTSLDPHPVDGHNDFFGVSFGDQSMQTWNNVVFADDYWRSDGNANDFDFDGESVDGAHQGDLNNSVQQEFVRSAHMAVTAYYVGTIDTSAVDGGDHPIFDSWYSHGQDGKAPRDATGWAFSRLGGVARPDDGIGSAFGGTASRVNTDVIGSQTGNVGELRIVGGTTTFNVGEKIPMRLKQQDRDGEHNISFWLDHDRNPFNENSLTKIRSMNFGEVDAVTTSRINSNPVNVPTGNYFVVARISDPQGHVRYAYSRRVTVLGTAASSKPASLAAAPIFSHQMITPPKDSARLVDGLI